MGFFALSRFLASSAESRDSETLLSLSRPARPAQFSVHAPIHACLYVLSALPLRVSRVSRPRRACRADRPKSARARSSTQSFDLLSSPVSYLFYPSSPPVVNMNARRPGLMPSLIARDELSPQSTARSENAHHNAVFVRNVPRGIDKDFITSLISNCRAFRNLTS